MRNPQGDGLFLVLKLKDGIVDTGSHTGSWQHKPPSRTYNTLGKAQAMATRYRNAGYGSRIAQITVAEDVPSIAWVDGISSGAPITDNEVPF